MRGWMVLLFLASRLRKLDRVLDSIAIHCEGSATLSVVGLGLQCEERIC